VVRGRRCLEEAAASRSLNYSGVALGTPAARQFTTLRERAMVDMARCEVLGIHWSSSLPAPRPASHPSTAALDL